MTLSWAKFGGGARRPAGLAHRVRAAAPRVVVGLIVAIGIVLYLLPVWGSRFLPLVDEQAHVTTAFIVRHMGDAAYRFGEFYRPRLTVVPYMLYYAITVGLSYLWSVETAHKLTLSIYALAIAGSAIVWVRRTGRPAWLALLAFPVIYTGLWSCGYHPFNLGLAAAFVAIVAYDAFLERPGWARGTLVATLFVLTFLGHILALAGAALSAVVLCLLYAPTLRRWFGSAIAAIPTIGLVVFQALRPKDNWVRPVGGFMDVEWNDHKLSAWRTYGFDSVSGSVDSFIFGGLISLAVVWMLAGAPGERSAGSSRPRVPLRVALLERRSLVLAIAAAVAYVAVPSHFLRPVYIWIVAGRLVPLVMFFGMLSLPVHVRDPRRWLMVPALTLVALLPLHLTARYRGYSTRLAPVVELVQRVPAGSNVLTLLFPPLSDPATQQDVHIQTPALVQRLRGGYQPHVFVHPVNFPFVQVAELPYPANFGTMPDLPSQAATFSHVLVLNEPMSFRGTAEPAYRGVGHLGQWSLYRRRHEPTVPTRARPIMQDPKLPAPARAGGPPIAPATNAQPPIVPPSPPAVPATRLAPVIRPATPLRVPDSVLLPPRRLREDQGPPSTP